MQPVTARPWLERSELGPAVLAARVRRQDWTAIIPAAGRGTRLAFDGPKILYPVAGRPILHHLLETLAPHCAQAVLVVAPQARAAVAAQLHQVPIACSVAVQPEPDGMAGAVLQALPRLQTAAALIVWGDQVALRGETIGIVARLLEGPLCPDAVIPTVWRAAPYIHFERDAAGRISRVLQAREGDPMPEAGESDAGVFALWTEALAAAFSTPQPAPRGAKTGEWNFLPVFAALAAGGRRVLTARIAGEAESIGVNTAAEAAALEQFLSRGMEASR